MSAAVAKHPLTALRSPMPCRSAHPIASRNGWRAHSLAIQNRRWARACARSAARGVVADPPPPPPQFKDTISSKASRLTEASLKVFSLAHPLVGLVRSLVEVAK